MRLDYQILLKSTPSLIGWIRPYQECGQQVRLEHNPSPCNFVLCPHMIVANLDLVLTVVWVKSVDSALYYGCKVTPLHQGITLTATRDVHFQRSRNIPLRSRHTYPLSTCLLCRCIACLQSLFSTRTVATRKSFWIRIKFTCIASLFESQAWNAGLPNQSERSFNRQRRNSRWSITVLRLSIHIPAVAISKEP